MAITVTQLTSGASGSNLTTYATASVSPGASKLILVLVGTTVSGAGNQLFPNTVAGAGLTFDMIDDAPGADSVSSRQLSVWRALSASPSTGTITITFPAAMLNCQWKVIEIDGIDTTGTNGSGAIVQFVAGTEATTATPSVTLAAFGDATNNAAVAGFIAVGNTTFAPGTGFTEIAEQTGTSPNTTLGFEYRIGEDTSVDATWGASALGQGFAIEVKAAGGGATTLTADSGSYSVTGTAASLEIGRKVAANSGSYAITGTAANLHRGFPMAAASGSYAVTGTAATLLKGSTVSATSGSYTINGTTASLEFNRKLTAGSGSYSVTGTDATLTYTPAGSVTLTADPGSYAFIGTAASLLVGRTLTAASGSYAVTGTAATLIAGPRLSATSGTVSVSGTTASLLTDRLLTADAASYSFTGTAASLPVARKLSAASGSYSETGTAATLLADRLLTAGNGTYVISGPQTTLTWSGDAGRSSTLALLGVG